MGDRGDIQFLQSGICLYTHWNASTMKNVVQKVLKKKQRWDDEAYLTRMIFCELVKGNESESTGFGISNNVAGDTLIKIDFEGQKITYDDKTMHFIDFIDEKLNGDLTGAIIGTTTDGRKTVIAECSHHKLGEEE